MKIVRIIKSLFKSYLSFNVTTLISFSLAFIFVMFEAITLFSFGVNYVATLNSTSHDDCYYNIDFKQTISIESLKSKIEQVEKISELRAYESRIAVDDSDNKFVFNILGGKDINALNLYTEVGRTYFSKDEQLGKNEAIIVASNTGLTIGDYVDFGNGNNIPVVGVFRYMANLCYVPISFAEKYDCEVTSFQFITEKRLNYFQILQLEKEIEKMGDVSVYFGGHTSTTDRKQFIKDISEFSILLSLFLLGLLFLSQFMSKKNARTYTILGLLGASKGDIGFYFLMERLLVVLFASIPAIVLHCLFGGCILDFVAGISNNMNAWNYVAVVLLSLICTLFMSLPYLISFINRSFSYCFKRSE